MLANTTLTERALHATLEAMRLGSPLRYEAVFTENYPFLETVDGATPAHRISNYLTSTICRRYNDLRQTMGLSQVTARESQNQALAILRDDFVIANKELEAWSLLYNRYVRIDIDLSFQYLSNVVHQSLRSLNRRQYLGLTRLLSHMGNQQVRFNRQQRKRILRAELPCPVPPHLVGRDLLLNWASVQLIAGPLRHLLIHGMPGIGKSSFACALAHRLIGELPLKHVVWLDKCDPNCLVEAVAQHLGVEPCLLRVYLQRVSTLVILDDAQALITDPGTSRHLQHWLGAARLIVCADKLPTPLPEMSCLHLPDLDRSDALDCLFTRIDPNACRKHSAVLENFDHLFGQLGGNPKALLLAGFPYSCNLQRIAEELCDPIWKNVSPLSRKIWMLASQSDQVLVDSLFRAPAFANYEKLTDALVELERYAVLVWVPECQGYRLAPLARTFACHMTMSTYDEMRPLLQPHRDEGMPRFARWEPDWATDRRH